MTHFQNLFKAQVGSSIAEIVWIAQLFPRYAEDEDNRVLMAVVTEEEPMEAILSFQKDKGPGPDSWSVEFFLGFYELNGMEVLGVVEES
jgi:hypothetical protein